MLLLICYALNKKFNKGGQVTCVNLVMASLATLNGIASIIRMNAFYTSRSDDAISDQTFIVAYCVENMAQFGAQWLFSIKYLEVARDLKFLL